MALSTNLKRRIHGLLTGQGVQGLLELLYIGELRTGHVLIDGAYDEQEIDEK